MTTLTFASIATYNNCTNAMRGESKNFFQFQKNNWDMSENQKKIIEICTENLTEPSNGSDASVDSDGLDHLSTKTI